MWRLDLFNEKTEMKPWPTFLATFNSIYYSTAFVNSAKINEFREILPKM